MKVFKYNFLYFTRQKFCLITYAIANLALIFYMIYRMIIAPICAATYQVRCSLKIAPILFIMFLFVSYYYFSKIKKTEMKEAISVSAIGKSGFYFNMFCVLFIFALITCVITFLLSIIYYIRVPARLGYFYFSIKASLLYFLLADVIAILIGLLCSGIKKTAPAYIILIICSILFSPLTNNITEVFFDSSNTSIYSIWRFFDIYPKHIGHDNPQYEIAVNTKALFIALFWISLCILIITLSFISFRSKKVKNISTVISIIFFAVSLLGAIAPFSEAPQDYSALGADTRYYALREPEKFIIQKNEEADFNITSYDMNFNIKNELKGDVTVYLDKNNLDEYKFTLYHGYRIKNIKDSSGNKLDFKRENDYVTVYPKSDTDTLTFEYKGHSPKYYSNYQGTCLPSGFTYYPINGFHYVFDIGNSKQGTIGVKLSEPVPMKVNIDCKNKMFCNLNRTEDNSFEGVSDGLTLVSGFYDETTVDDTRLVYQYYNNDFTNEKNLDYNKHLKEYLNEYPDYDATTIIILPNTGSPARDECRFESYDHITASSVYDAFKKHAFIEESPVNARLDMFFAFMKYYDKDSELYKLTQMDVNEFPEDADELNVILAKKIKEYGDDIYIKVRNAGEHRNCNTAEEVANMIGVEVPLQHLSAVN